MINKSSNEVGTISYIYIKERERKEHTKKKKENALKIEIIQIGKKGNFQIVESDNLNRPRKYVTGISRPA